MQKILSLLFCVASLAAVAGVTWLAYPYAARSSQDVADSVTPQGAEMFEDVDLGDFGLISVLDMMQHYIDSPPLEADGGETQVRFQGC